MRRPPALHGNDGFIATILADPPIAEAARSDRRRLLAVGVDGSVGRGQAGVQLKASHFQASRSHFQRKSGVGGARRRSLRRLRLFVYE